MFAISWGACYCQAFPALANCLVRPGGYSRVQHLNRLHLGRRRPCPQTLDQAANPCQGQTLQLIMRIFKLRRKKFCNIGPRPILKSLFQCKLQFFINKLECLQLSASSMLVFFPGWGTNRGNFVVNFPPNSSAEPGSPF